MATANKKFNTGRIKFTFSDEDGEVFSSFKMNPTDANVIARAEEVSEYFNKRKLEVDEIASGKDLAKYNKEIEDKINYLLGYDASEEIFGEITATTISPDGEVFGVMLMEFVFEKLKPEIEKRKKNMNAAIDKYTKKYES